MRKFLGGIILLVLLLVVAGMAGAESEITLNTPTIVDITIPGDVAIFEYTPTTDGYFRYYSRNIDEGSYYPHGYLLDEDMQLIADNENGLGDGCFVIGHELKANKKYYFASSIYSNEIGTYKVQLDRIDGFFAEAKKEVVYARQNRTGTVEVNAYSPYGGLTYQWYDGNNAIAEATNSKYVFPALTQEKTYKCVVKDAQNTTREVTVQAKIESGLFVSISGNMEVEYGGSTELTATATAQYGADQITYQWFEEIRNADNIWEYRKLEGETSPTLILNNVTKRREICCEAKDINGQIRSRWIAVTVPGRITLSGVGGTEKEVIVGSSLTMAVTAESDSGYPVSCQWYRLSRVGDYENREMIPGATGTSYTLQSVSASGRYYCEATDSVGNSRGISFYVTAKDAFSASADGINQITVNPGESATLKVKAKGIGDLSYQWYYYNQTFERNVPMKGATAATLIGNLKAGSYYCRVSDSVGNEGRVAFGLTIDNQFSAKADSGTDLLLNEGETATLKVKVTSSDPDVMYRWYRREYVTGDDYFEEKEIIAGAETNTLTVTAGERCSYGCVVSDHYGNSRTINFSIKINNAFTVNPVSQTSFIVNPGESVTLAVTGNCADGDIIYRWSHYTQNNGDKPLRESTESSFVIDSVGKDTFGTYYLYAYDSYGNTRGISFNVAVENHFTASVVGETTVSVNPGEDATFAVTADCEEGEITYEWYQRVMWNNSDSWYYEQIADEQGSTLQLTNIQKATDYYCNVRDEFGGRTQLWFYVRVNNELTAKAKNGQNNFTVDIGDSITMEVVASCKNGPLTYKWYEEVRHEDYWSDELIDGATDSSYTISEANKAGRFVCYVYDQYDNRTSIWFYTYVRNELTAHPLNYKNNITIEAGETATMTVEASCKEGELTYQWYQFVRRDEGGQTITYRETIQGATQATYTTEVLDRAGEYSCEVRDSYGNDTSVWFNIYINNELEAEPQNHESQFLVEPGETATFEVEASCKNGTLSYQWYRQISPEESGKDYWEDRIINGATGTTYTTGSITKRETYYCRVSDMYENTTSVWFYVNIDNDLTVVPVGTKTKRVEVGNDVELAVQAECSSGGLTYAWYEGYRHEEGNGNWWYQYYDEPIEGANGPAYTVENVTGRCRYRCVVTDKYGNTKEIEFNIYVENKLTATSENYNSTIPIGETTTLRVIASTGHGGLRYQWYRYIEVEENNGIYWRREIIDGETAEDYTTEPLSGLREEYICSVSDDYGNSQEVWFYLYAANAMTVEPVGRTMFSVSEAPITMTVEVNSQIEGITLSYRWYDKNYNIIESATGNSYTLTNPVAGTYYCSVSNGYRSEEVRFYVTEGANAQSNGNNSVYCTPGDPVTFKVAAWNAEDDITYQWYEYRNGSDDIKIEGATEPTYSLIAGNFRKSFYCAVKGTGLNTHVWFYVYIRNNIRISTTGMSRINIIPEDGSIQLAIHATSDMDDALQYGWSKNYETIQNETNNTLTVTEGGRYYGRAYDCYENSTGEYFYCIEGQPETVKEGVRVTGPNSSENGGFTVYQFVPAKTGTYKIEAEGWYYIYKPNEWDGYLYLSDSTTSARLTEGQVYYVLLTSQDQSFKYTLATAEETERTFTLHKGLNLRISSQYLNGRWDDFDHATSSDRSVIRINDSKMEVRAEGTTDVTVTYESGAQQIYHITVTGGSTLTLPAGLQTIETDAFNGDASARFIVLGSGLTTVKSGAFANIGDMNVTISTYRTTFEDGVFSNSNPVFIFNREGVEDYCRRNNIPYFYVWN